MNANREKLPTHLPASLLDLLSPFPNPYPQISCPTLIPSHLSCLQKHFPSFPHLMSSPYLGMDRGFLETVSTAHSDVDAARVRDSVLGHPRDVLPVCVVSNPTALKLGKEGGMAGKVPHSNLHLHPEPRIFHPHYPSSQPPHSLFSATRPELGLFCCL